MIFDEVRIHKYIHINNKLNVLNIKYNTFLFKFRYNRVLQQKVTRRCGSDTLNDTMVTPCPKMLPSEAVNTYGVSQYSSNHRVWITHW
jgi:hypothetical protein